MGFILCRQHVKPLSLQCRFLRRCSFLRHGQAILATSAMSRTSATHFACYTEFAPLCARAAGGQRQFKGKDEKGHKDIRFSVHRRTTFLYFAPPSRIQQPDKARPECFCITLKSCSLSNNIFFKADIEFFSAFDSNQLNNGLGS